MPPSCVTFYQTAFPDLLGMFNLLLVLFFLAALISYLVFVLAILEIKVQTPRYVITALAYLEDLGPFNFYKTHVILSTECVLRGAWRRNVSCLLRLELSG